MAESDGRNSSANAPAARIEQFSEMAKSEAAAVFQNVLC